MTTMSPTLTTSAVSLPMPMSTKNSLTSGTFLRSSGLEMWIGLPPGFITPL